MNDCGNCLHNYTLECILLALYMQAVKCVRLCMCRNKSRMQGMLYAVN